MCRKFDSCQGHLDCDIISFMEPIYLEKNIFYYENFLTTEMLNWLKSEINDDRPWQGIGSGYENVEVDTENSWFKNVKALKDENMQKVLRKKLDDIMPTHGLIGERTFQYPRSIMRYPTGNMMGEHFDGDPNFPGINKIKWAGVMYINDDFEGGEIEYPNFNIKLKPKPGMLIVHHGGKDYLHKVNTITSGTRYMMNTFVSDDIVNGPGVEYF